LKIKHVQRLEENLFVRVIAAKKKKKRKVTGKITRTKRKKKGKTVQKQ
jgi:hypothetical protein